MGKYHRQRMVVNCNQNGLLLLGLCVEHALTITNTLFRTKTTWRHLRSKHWQFLDYAIIRQPDRKDVLVTRTKPSADDCWTDHRLLITRLGISIRSKPKVNHHLPSRKKFDVSKLHDPTIHDEYEKTIHGKLMTNPIDPLSVEEEWKTIRDTISESAKAILGFIKRKIKIGLMRMIKRSAASLTQNALHDWPLRMIPDPHSKSLDIKTSRENVKPCSERSRTIGCSKKRANSNGMQTLATLETSMQVQNSSTV